MTSIKELKAEKLKFKNEHTKYVEISNLLGHKYQELGRYSEAINEHLDAVQACDKIKNQISCLQLKAVSRRALGECYSEMSMHAEALVEHNQFLSLTLEMNVSIEIQRAYATIGRTYLLWALDTDDNKRSQRAILNKSISSFQKALELCENLMSSGKLKDREYADMKSRLLLNLGLVYENLGDYDKCKPLLFDSIQLTKGNYLYDEHFRCQISLGSIFEKLHSFDEALSWYEQALDTAKLFKNKIKQFDALICLGLIMMKQENVEKSRNYFKKAYLLDSPVEEDKQKAARLLKISSVILDDVNSLQENLKCTDKAMVLCDRLGDHFVEMKCFDLAINYYKKELYYATEANQSDNVLAKIYVSIGQTYLDDGNYEEAINYFQHEYNFNLGNKCEQCTSLLKIADIQECWYSNMDELDVEECQMLKEKIITSYEAALNLFDLSCLIQCTHKSNTGKNNELRLYVQAVNNYLHFLEINHLNCSKQKALRDNLSKLNVQNIVDADDEIVVDSEDLYEKYSLDLLSSPSDRSFGENDEEIPENYRTRPKRNGKCSKVTNRLNQFGETPLHTACIAGNIVQVERLIEQKANLNAKDYCGWTPLHEACNHGHLEIAECLIRNGANIESCDDRSDRITALHDACNCGHFSIIRLLLRNGANVLALTAHSETPLECLMNWRQRTESELNQNELDDCIQLENQMMNAMKEKGFDLNKLLNSRTNRKNSTNPTNTSKQRNLVNDTIYDDDDNEPDRTIDSAMKLNYENPRLARKEYENTIQSFRRNRLKFSTGGNCYKRTTQSALTNDAVVRDDWLIDDLQSKKKSRKRDKDDILYCDTKKMRSNSVEDIFIDDFDDDELMTGIPNSPTVSIIFDDDDVVPCQSAAKTLSTTIELVDNEQDGVDHKIFVDTTKSQSSKQENLIEVEMESVEENVSKIITVCFDDIEKSSFGVPVIDPAMDCKMLVEEVCKRYFLKYGIKPIIALETCDGAELSDDHLLINLVDVNETINATISSWIIDPADQRYNELCVVNELEVDETIESCLKLVNISGLFNISNAFIPSNRHIRIMFQTLFQQEIKELDISYTNVLIQFDSYQAFQRSLCSISTLETLNIACVCYPSKHLSCLLNISPVLKKLDLSFNSIGDENTYTITQIIKSCEKLEHLNLIGCDLSETFVRNKLLISSIQNSSLKSVLLHYNDIDDGLVDKFKTLEKSNLFLKDL